MLMHRVQALFLFFKDQIRPDVFRHAAPAASAHFTYVCSPVVFPSAILQTDL
ncbi:hypothetical protein PAHAL_1G016800 [Panicum hallii]|uniref:Uncharacterized protein n=1 Tax=Panicum hallii TaxID=206008 RepID=A0A2T8KTP4_9POAL|nr:hypothetical protein PAHAL_1G016800 [Panicum hallii]